MSTATLPPRISSPAPERFEPPAATPPARRRRLPAHWKLHAIVLTFGLLTLIPFVFVINNSFRTNNELYHSFFGFPNAFKTMARGSWLSATGHRQPIEVINSEGNRVSAAPGQAAQIALQTATKGYAFAWKIIRPYILNSLFVCITVAFGVLALGSITAYILSRYHFPGKKVIFYLIISTMMFPAILTFVPSFLMVKALHMLNSYQVLIIPAIAGGQVFAIFVFKSFFDGLPEDLFESARIDGAGHWSLYWNIVVPLSKPVMSVVLVMNVIGTWNNFLWVYVTNNDTKYHTIAAGLYVMATSGEATNFSTLFSAYLLSSLPLLILFTYATKPFIQGMTSGAFKA